MRNFLLDEASAAEIMGVDRPTVQGWCKNAIINCIVAPEEYAGKTMFLISEEECTYLSNLISKFGARKALLNYNKTWKDTSAKVSRKEEEMNNDVLPSQEVIPKESPPEIKSMPLKENADSDKLVSSIIHAHTLKERIEKYKEELKKLEDEYTELKSAIVTQI